VVFVFAITLFSTINTQAQETENFEQGFHVGIGFNSGIPIIIENYDYSLGADVRLQYDYSKKVL
jgi:hypothetical protein